MIKLIKDDRITITSGKNFKLKNFDTDFSLDFVSKESAGVIMQEHIQRIAALQERLYASDNHAILMIFQARDAAGKDSTIKHVMSGINPSGCQVVSFKVPTSTEIEHDFLWRTAVQLPERGRIGIFNRSYYEEVLVTKVHPEIILNQRLPSVLTEKDLDKKFWEHRYESIRDHEKHLSRNGFVILKFFLNVSKKEQKKRFLERIDQPDKNWKFSYGDIKERQYWDQYEDAFEQMIEETAEEHAPWFVIPSDKKWFAQLAVARILLETLESLDLKFPELGDEEKAVLEKAKMELESEKD
ncbi:polyphosphate kinase 2 family protein [Solitalea canadensis]|uniref:Polyphosphate:nucleotide phosphotransferase, PPK2 family n=1 Tax=Solitalea canadensis (strain ATCC 29591 / DSM 3403 / JCM 21819 / LMG 8368 / NBRC 15130 / NCIMB 12057 / USAM 9D) TaxID=929556 RepID=H8KM43_SOLCM|nr:polyphosphate kinase 2 family protein [Solitalea canadensis]AFD08965.1 polyphosphate:nucleotide phosphotransferase, PPK2 family [Solitalea canadensis DSM 3403]